MRSYHFDLGNSTSGPIGYCARVRADSREQAVELLREALPQDVEIEPSAIELPGVEYINAYINDQYPTVHDIDEEEPCPASR